MLLNDFSTPAESRRGLPADGSRAAAVLCRGGNNISPDGESINLIFPCHDDK